MSKKVLGVGNCGFDHSSLRSLIEGSFDAELASAASAKDALDSADGADLILVNRKFDADGGDGLSLIRALKQQESTQAIPVMLISNYAEYQQQAEDLGAEPGFGKSDLRSADTLEKLRRWLD